MVRTAFQPRWLPRHVLMLALVAVLSLLGRWQWDVSGSQRGGLQNLLYAFQWWFMAGMVIYGWWRLLHDDARPREASAAAGEAAAGLPAPATTPCDDSFDDDAWPTRVSASIEAELATDEVAEAESDEDLARYNEYLAWLNKRAQSAR